MAHQLLQACEALRALPPLEQLAALQLADDMRVKEAADKLVARMLFRNLGLG